MKSEPAESRLMRVDAIRTMVEDGTYEVPAEVVADAILRHHRGRLRIDSPNRRTMTPEPPERDNYH